MLSDILRFHFAKLRRSVGDNRESSERLAVELDKLADLMTGVLDVTSPEGEIRRDKLPELDMLRKQVWSRWVSMLGTDGYAAEDCDLREEIEKCVKIVLAAPGAFVEEVYLVQLGLAKGHIDQAIRARFSKSISSIRDLTTRMRLSRSLACKCYLNDDT